MGAGGGGGFNPLNFLWIRHWAKYTQNTGINDQETSNYQRFLKRISIGLESYQELLLNKQINLWGIFHLFFKVTGWSLNYRVHISISENMARIFHFV